MPALPKLVSTFTNGLATEGFTKKINFVSNKFTANGKDLFHFFDNKKTNRTLGFTSPTGLKALAESKYYHLDGTFHTSTGYMAQLYVIHAFFPSTSFKSDDTVWVKRMIPCAWFFMKRRRTKDYAEVIAALVEEAKKHNLLLKPLQVMIDFELAAQRAFEAKFPGVTVKGCLFHFGQTLFKNFVKVGLKQDYLENERANLLQTRLLSCFGSNTDSSG
jgi:hypothetical protein